MPRVLTTLLATFTIVSGSIVGVAACTSPGIRIERHTIADSAIIEASGLARGAFGDRLWIINDGGSAAELHAVGRDGRSLGAVVVRDVMNRDWEDLAALDVDGRNALLIADVGDNAAAREMTRLIVVAEPDLRKAAVEPLFTIGVRLPDGPADVEAVAVDSAANDAYLLTKRTLPPRLYRVSLDSEVGTTDAELLGPIASLPAPTEADLRLAPVRMDWHWQPTAMDFSADGSAAAILTYRAVYHYQRAAGQSWLDALNAAPTRIVPIDIPGAEALALDDARIWVTHEGQPATLLEVREL